MPQEALNVLKEILALREDQNGGRRANRLLSFLKSNDDESQQGWFFYVPTNFNEALDIKQTPRKKDNVQYTIWTQGGRFYFKPGDVLYDTPDAYKNWLPRRPHFRYCLQVDKAQASTPATITTKRNSGCVEFTVFVNENKENPLTPKGKYSLTQDGFVHFLITGNSSELNLTEGK